MTSTSDKIGSAPSINWNAGSKTKIRTTLGGGYKPQSAHSPSSEGGSELDIPTAPDMSNRRTDRLASPIINPTGEIVEDGNIGSETTDRPSTQSEIYLVETLPGLASKGNPPEAINDQLQPQSSGTKTDGLAEVLPKSTMLESDVKQLAEEGSSLFLDVPKKAWVNLRDHLYGFVRRFGASGLVGVRNGGTHLVAQYASAEDAAQAMSALDQTNFSPQGQVVEKTVQRFEDSTKKARKFAAAAKHTAQGAGSKSKHEKTQQSLDTTKGQFELLLGMEARGELDTTAIEQIQREMERSQEVSSKDLREHIDRPSDTQDAILKTSTVGNGSILPPSKASVENSAINQTFAEETSSAEKGDISRIEGEVPKITTQTRDLPGTGSHDSRLYLGNLPFSASEADIMTFFAGFNVESCSIPNNPRTGRPVGYGFVVLPTVAEAENAIVKLLGKSIANREISIEFARHPRGERDGGAQIAGEKVTPLSTRRTHEHDLGLRDVSSRDSSDSEEIQNDPMLTDYSQSDQVPATQRSEVESPRSIMDDVEYQEPASSSLPVPLAQYDPSRPTVLADLSSSDLELQLRYEFGPNAKASDVDLDQLATCLICRGKGHMAVNCRGLTCRGCGAYDQHMTRACPKQQTCQRCRRRGHSKEACPSKLAHSTADGITCDLCHKDGHYEESCDKLWRTFDPDSCEPITKTKDFYISCYECGRPGHFGGDCPMRPPGKPKGIAASTFCMAYAGRFLDLSNYKPPTTNRTGYSIRGRASHDPMIMLDDSDDDSANFYRPRIDSRAPARGHIRFVQNGLSTGRNNTGNSNNSNNRPRDVFSHQPYRERDNYSHAQTRRRDRSMSPPPPPYPVRAGGNSYRPDRWLDGGREDNGWQPPLPREPLPSRGGRGGRGPGRGARGSKASGVDAYRPMPSAAKSAWSKHRT
ncbi:MAG: hypothetical protein M1827_003668 [Pycnora praestabilis]|nr:MAG: hypothetical protein M1827_003668 [Pycnora praestabilis]